jgi:hypothetical protein
MTHTINGVPPMACLHCGTIVNDVPPDGVPATASEATRVVAKVRPSVFDHRFMPAVTGRCLRNGCGKLGDDHAPLKENPGDGTCPLDHRAQRPWSACGLCGDVVEPKVATGQPTGPADGKGRGAWSERVLNRLRDGWRGGYWQS